MGTKWCGIHTRRCEQHTTGLLSVYTAFLWPLLAECVASSVSCFRKYQNSLVWGCIFHDTSICRSRLRGGTAPAVMFGYLSRFLTPACSLETAEALSVCSGGARFSGWSPSLIIIIGLVILLISVIIGISCCCGFIVGLGVRHSFPSALRWLKERFSSCNDISDEQAAPGQSRPAELRRISDMARKTFVGKGGVLGPLPKVDHLHTG